MPNFKLANLGLFSERAKEMGSDAHKGWKIFLKDKLDLTSCEISLNIMSKGEKSSFRHKHSQNEEVYIFLEGEGVMSIDNDNFPVKEGICVKVLPSGCRGIENTGDGELCYICIQAKENSLTQYTFEDGKKCE